MLKKVTFWFSCLVISFIVSSIFGLEQEKVFFAIYFGSNILIILGISCFLFVVGLITNSTREASGMSVLLFFVTAVIFGIVILTSWIISCAFRINFYLAYELISLVQCFISIPKKIKKNKE